MAKASGQKLTPITREAAALQANRSAQVVVPAMIERDGPRRAEEGECDAERPHTGEHEADGGCVVVATPVDGTVGRIDLRQVPRHESSHSTKATTTRSRTQPITWVLRRCTPAWCRRRAAGRSRAGVQPCPS